MPTTVAFAVGIVLSAELLLTLNLAHHALLGFDVGERPRPEYQSDIIKLCARVDFYENASLRNPTN
jgi:hypothetical protein